ncbi:MAG: tail fiber protein [Sphingomonas sp.]|jgi:microcystin-dependent protein|uniref:phage tail protein n=1 Tax=Sphingomonas sp. TaxID=28214 RepID=UPI00356214F2
MGDYFTGQIILTAFDKPMNNWALCQGQLLKVRDFEVLFALLGTRYGGDGVSTFGLPNLNGSVPIGAGQGTASGATNHVLAARGGSETVTLTDATIPPHSHSVNATSNTSSTSTFSASVVYGSDPTNTHKHYENPVPSGAKKVALYDSSVSTAGGSSPHANIMPTIGLAYQICLNGLFPVNQ